MSRRVQIVAWLLTFLTLGLDQALGAPTDFNQDGRSEFVTVSPTAVNTLEFFSTDLSGGTPQLRGSLGVLGNHVALGAWIAARTPTLAVVAQSQGLLQWSIVGADGSVTAQSFGNASDTLLSGADIDGDGFTDALTSGASGRRRVWKVSRNLFTQNRTDAEFSLGFTNETPLFVPQGDRTLPATIVTGNRGATTLRVFDPATNRARRIRLPRAPTTTRPHPLRLANEESALAYVVPEGDGVRLIIQSLTSPRSAAQEVVLAVSGTVVVGDFLDSAGEEIGFHVSTTLTVFSPATSQIATFVVPSGIAVDEVNINSFSTNPTPPDPSRPPSPDPSPPSGEPITPSDPSLAAVCASATAILPGEMLIKSEPSNHIGRHDPRTSGYTVVCARECPANTRYAQFFFANGEFAGAVAKYGVFSGNGRPRLYGAVGAAPAHDAAAIAARAAGIGNGKLYLQVSTATTGVETRCKEFAPAGRNGSL